MKNASAWVLCLALIGSFGSGCLEGLPEEGGYESPEKASVRSDTGHYTQMVWANTTVRNAYYRDLESGAYDLADRDDTSPYHCGALTCTCDDAVDCDEMHAHDVMAGDCSSTGDGDSGETCCIRESCNAAP